LENPIWWLLQSTAEAVCLDILQKANRRIHGPFLPSGNSVAWINEHQNHKGFGIPWRNHAEWLLFFGATNIYKTVALGLKRKLLARLIFLGEA
jgi:hypothetical protein